MRNNAQCFYIVFCALLRSNLKKDVTEKGAGLTLRA